MIASEELSRKTIEHLSDALDGDSATDGAVEDAHQKLTEAQELLGSGDYAKAGQVAHEGLALLGLWTPDR